MNDEVSLEVVYPSPIERVWQALTTKSDLERWLLPNDFEAELGKTFRLRRKRADDVRCEIVALEEPFRLVYTWECDDAPLSVVSWTLTAVDDDSTRVQLRHEPAGVEMQCRLGLAWSRALRRGLPWVLGVSHVSIGSGYRLQTKGKENDLGSHGGRAKLARRALVRSLVAAHERPHRLYRR